MSTAVVRVMSPSFPRLSEGLEDRWAKAVAATDEPPSLVSSFSRVGVKVGFKGDTFPVYLPSFLSTPRLHWHAALAKLEASSKKLLLEDNCVRSVAACLTFSQVLFLLSHLNDNDSLVIRVRTINVNAVDVPKVLPNLSIGVSSVILPLLLTCHEALKWLPPAIRCIVHQL